MRTSGVITALLALAALGGCNSYPRDIEGTFGRVSETRQLRVGFGQIPADQRTLAERYVSRVAQDSGALVKAERSASNEALFARLEDGKLDLVVTEVALDSPWLTEVAVIEPLATRRLGKREIGLSAVARNGENRWVMRLEAAARDMAAGS